MLHNFDPFLQYTGEYVPELQAFFANVTAATRGEPRQQRATTGRPRSPASTTCARCRSLSPESLAIYPKRIGTDRANPYFQPGAFSALGNGGLPVFSRQLVRELGAVGERAAQRNDLRRASSNS